MAEVRRRSIIDQSVMVEISLLSNQFPINSFLDFYDAALSYREVKH